ncbi:cyclic beta 1-2 glucan synthetase [Cellvibrio zantedeschiae]|uniref:Cyclic beta 1-2 glucan synthetase n=1 Tax=Cellvibrio zantedeschiae TaxID=1237077 RepID=A0ABQ3AVM5_9GAMM|nr:glucoamylase family protein [Cellvibrio zantedeschiae]GGY69182.1 cyclic beta 1-2 glucan synthetase [Cellvibrio zantedeschiae]
MKPTSWGKTLELDTGRLFGRNDNLEQDNQPPLRAELFSADQMEQHGRALAGIHHLGPLAKSTRLLERLDDNEQVLLDCRALLTETVKTKTRIAPAGEWLLDNFYLIEEQIRTARKHLPKRFNRELPRLADGPSEGLPRVYDLALAVISHGDGRIDIETLSRFIAAYQTLNPLTLGELWATPIMLRLALIENLRRVAARISSSREYFNKAQEWANSMIEIAERDPKNLIVVIADMARSNPPMVSSFVAELTRRLQGHGPALALPLTWIEQRLAESSLTIEQMVLIETQQQAADQVSISNSIGSLRVLGATDWRYFVEAMSVVEKTLHQDPADIYRKMDFATRDSYRRVIDNLAKHSKFSEGEIANSAIQLAHASANKSDPDKAHTAHVGYYLVDKGLPQLERAVRARLPIMTGLRRIAGYFPLSLHVGSIVLLTLLFSSGLLAQVRASDVDGWPLWVIGILALIATSQLASALVNWLAMMMVKPTLLPRMNFDDGLPKDARTMVVIPTLLCSIEHTDELLEALEVRFLGNRDANLYFALLTDFGDAAEEVLPSDSTLLEYAQKGIERLNEKYPLIDTFDGDTRIEPETSRFFLFHRPRLWNAVDQVWMGHERKRGKLADLNAFLRADADNDQAARAKFSLIVGKTAKLHELKYIITLDTDTQLPRDSAREFVGTMAHPLNRPRFDKNKRCVIGGYGILQPRIAASMAGANRSVYARLFGSEPGIDPYTRSVSDIYQDLFNEGSFIGKGIYDIDAFEFTLKDRLPENRILSHDLLEGCHARSGLISDVQLLEEYPTHYTADVTRRSRWIRGDWQIASWILPRVPGANGKSAGNPLSALSRWKIMDNLVRSLAPIALLLLLLLGWCIAGDVWFWTLTVTGIILIPTLLFAVVDTLIKPEEVSLQEHLAAVVKSAARNVAQAAFRLGCLPHEALYSLAAILCSMGRVLFTRRLLLEWNVYSYNSDASSLPETARIMWSNYAISIIAILGLSLLNPFGLVAAAPVILLWLATPYIAWKISQPAEPKAADLPSRDLVFLRKIARKTWAFFDRFVTAEDNWLPPDNMQEDPGPIIAHRTSPTNIGLALLSNLTAYDFGYSTTGELLVRTTDTFDTMGKMERHFGHFYNWYDTRNLQPLPPRYISTVDSGNLVGHLLTLRAGLIDLPKHPITGPQVFDGLMDTLLILADNSPLPHQPLIAQLINLVKAASNAQPNTLKGMLHFLNPILAGSAMVSEQFDTLLDTEAGFWAQAFIRQTGAVHKELFFLAPWLELADPPSNIAHLNDFDRIPTLEELARYEDVLLAHQILATSLVPNPEFTLAEQAWLDEKRGFYRVAHERAKERIKTINQLVAQSTDFATIDYEFLYDPNRKLLAIGYNVDDFRRDASFYDLLASEARLCNFIAIAQDQLPQESWFALGRLRTSTGGEPTLVSWSGSMFEYLMPMLVMPTYDNTLLDQTCRGAVARQIAYGKQRGLPWGISESGYNTVDASLNYQYHAFGVPGLGLKRGLSEDTVIAPYATVMALMVDPESACDNLRRLSAIGLEGRYGFYEAMDYTPARLNRGQTNALICSFMVHHQGMSLLSLAYVLLNRPMQARFESDPALQSTLLLLQERIPKRTVIHNRSAEDNEGSAFFDTTEGSVHTAIGADTPTPDVQLLSNGRYQVMLTNAGGGYSRWREFAVTRWREDTTCDSWGSFIYVRDVESADFWSAAHQPTLKRADSYAAMFSEGRAEYRRRDSDIETYSEIVVSPEDDIELRRVRITNRSGRRRVIEVTSYAEVVLGTQAADATQTAFGKLFVQTEILPNNRALLCTKRPRSAEEFTPWMFHLLAVQGGEVTKVSYETDRLKFIGRGRTLVSPKALTETDELSGSQGSVLDPVVAIRCQIVLEADQWITLNYVTGAAVSRDASMIMIEKYQDYHFADRAFDLAATHSGVTLRQINANESDALLYRRLARSVIYSHSGLRADPAIIQQNRRGQSGLWGYAISGDLPIVLLKIANSDHIELARQLIQCHIYWRMKGLMVDLVIWNEDHAGYRQRLQDQIIGLIATGTEANTIDRPGGIFVRSAEQISHEDRVLLQSVARVIVADGRGTLLEQINRRPPVEKRIPRLKPSRRYRAEEPQDLPLPDLRLRNPFGGFSADGREYVIVTHPDQVTPLPWVNVLANPNFGSVVTESGLAYTWSENAHEYRLTPWSDDAVGATGGEAIYLRDEETGHFWSPSPLPCRSKTPYITRHGFGYSVFEHIEDGIVSELWVYVDLVESVKYSVLKVRNQSGRNRRLSATGYVEWVLGDLRSKTAMHVVTEIDATSGALFAYNAYSTEFGSRVSFFDVDDISRTLSGDRTEFLGRNGSISNPDAMSRVQLSGRLGAAFDPCGAIQVPFELGNGQSRELIFRLGSGHDLTQTRALAQRLRLTGTARAALQRVQAYWQQTLSAVQVETPDESINMLANGWLMYQTLACRIWARSGYYQSGGAYGFRDQLQDTMALVHTRPELMREHLIRSAQRQYPQGDVQHWWHPPIGRGVRTRCSDDYLWLPAAVCRYVQATGDTSVLDERLHFLDGRELNPDEESYYDLPGHSAEAATVYQHCQRAIQHGLRYGEHGIPLMGSGDWNDGMNLVGIHGKGESVWLGFFLYDVLVKFADLAGIYNDQAYVEFCEKEAFQLRRNLEMHAWDGAWYKRAWFDDGTALGTATNSECAIDSISQSWSVLSGAGSDTHSQTAMESLDKHLVRRDHGLIQLLNPPFDKSTMNPGYIKGYVPGVRENGGQYTHAAVWAIMAFAALGDSKRAWELLTLINPLNHTDTEETLNIYKAEPYVVAADVYGVAPHIGRGGWSWYTGSAGLFYRLIIESLLGISRVGNQLHINPCIPENWPGYKVSYRFGKSLYHIAITQSTGKPVLTLNGVLVGKDYLNLVDDGLEHQADLSGSFQKN